MKIKIKDSMGWVNKSKVLKLSFGFGPLGRVSVMVVLLLLLEF